VHAVQLIHKHQLQWCLCDTNCHWRTVFSIKKIMPPYADTHTAAALNGLSNVQPMRHSPRSNFRVYLFLSRNY